jgi:hypothetical protein
MKRPCKRQKRKIWCDAKSARSSAAAGGMQHPQPVGDRCAFPRNLTRGTYGGDVNCLQQHLAHQARKLQRVPRAAACFASWRGVATRGR